MLTGELPIGRFAPPSKKVQIDVRLDEVVLRAGKRAGAALPAGQRDQDPRGNDRHHAACRWPCQCVSPDSADAIEQARRQVKGPAIGLLVTGIVDWVTLTPSAIVMSGTLQGYLDGPMVEGAPGPPFTMVLIVVGFAFACGILMILLD